MIYHSWSSQTSEALLSSCAVQCFRQPYPASTTFSTHGIHMITGNDLMGDGREHMFDNLLIQHECFT